MGWYGRFQMLHAGHNQVTHAISNQPLFPGFGHTCH